MIELILCVFAGPFKKLGSMGLPLIILGMVGLLVMCFQAFRAPKKH